MESFTAANKSTKVLIFKFSLVTEWIFTMKIMVIFNQIPINSRDRVFPKFIKNPKFWLALPQNFGFFTIAF